MNGTNPAQATFAFAPCTLCLAETVRLRVSSRGAVRELENGNWLAAWGDYQGSTLAANRRVTVSEVDPATDPPTVVFALNMARRAPAAETVTYRAYREREADIDVPLNLP